MVTKLFDISNWCRQGAEVEGYPYIGEVNIDVTLDAVLNVGGKYYAPGVLNIAKKYAGVREIELDLKPDDKDYESNVTCPYCGYSDEDSWELDEEDEKHECGRCGAIISFQRVVTTEYNSSPVKPPEIIKAKWVNAGK